MSRRIHKWLYTPVLLIASIAVPAAFAQETTAGVQGTVKDPSNAMIAGATVEVSGPALIGGSRKVTTDDGGNYRIAALPAGVYTITVSAKGFRTDKLNGIELSVGRLPTIDIRLQVGGVSETVEVSSIAPIVDTTQSKVQVTVEKSILDNIPKGRSFETLIPFAPGARSEPLMNGYQIDGASDGENAYLIDGVNTTQIQNGGVGKSFQMEFIQEVQIKSSSFEAEYGGALGGVINALPKHGSNDFHGELLSYLRSNAFNANNGDRGLRLNPSTSLNTSQRLDGIPEYYMANKDQRTIVEPGYDIGGAILKNKLWFFSSYIPTIDTTRRTTNFTGPNAGPRTLTSTFTQHNAYNRLDYGVTNSLRLFASWNYGYSRSTGTLGGQDSAAGQRNTGATTDPTTLRSDNGSVNPLSVYTFGGDWTPTAKLVLSVRYGYFFNNNEERGKPVGIRYSYNGSVTASSVDLGGVAFPASAINNNGFANIPSNLAYVYDAYKRKSLNVDSSYFVHFGGTHTIKGGYFWQGQSNAVLRNLNGGSVIMYWNQSYVPQGGSSNCDPIIAQNQAQFAKSVCQGRYGYFSIGNSVTNTGSDEQTAHAIYLQDSWQVGHGLTLNVGVRLDKETQPPFDPKRFPTLAFGLGDKIAPRIGGAYDLLHNGKVKVYGSYGKFFDIMKMGLARGSFGSDYWHNCVYALDDADYTKITPTLSYGGGCPTSGPAPGVTVGRFIENVDLRATKADPRDPAISPTMKPMLQHEFVAGVDWAINNTWGLETRYSRKRLDRTIEDMAITDTLGFYIGNPGSPFADLMHRPLSIPCPANNSGCTPDAAGNYLMNTVFCAECPTNVGAIRRYDGVEFRLAKRPTGKWFGTVSYTYSKLTGNYSGLTSTDEAGRHSPNNNRFFDIPTQTFLPNGKIDDGDLATDRPHTAKAYGFYRLKTKAGETLLGVTQSAFQGTPITTCILVFATGGACEWGEGRGNFVKYTRASNGDLVPGDIVHNARTDPYVQTDLTFNHHIPVHERARLEFEANISNLFNQRATTAYNYTPMASSMVNPRRTSRFPGDPGLDWGLMMHGFNYTDAMNGKGAFAPPAGSTTPLSPALTLASRYGMPTGFQTARSIRLAMRFTF
jgi:hypothetical protein